MTHFLVDSRIVFDTILHRAEDEFRLWYYGKAKWIELTKGTIGNIKYSCACHSWMSQNSQFTFIHLTEAFIQCDWSKNAPSDLLYGYCGVLGFWGVEWLSGSFEWINMSQKSNTHPQVFKCKFIGFYSPTLREMGHDFRFYYVVLLVKPY